MKKYKVILRNCLKPSVNGNPRFELTLQDVETGKYIQCKTKSDYNYNYEIENSYYREFLMAKITYTKAGNAYIDSIGKVEAD